MKKSNLTLAALSLATACLLPTSASAEIYNQTITAIFGSGNPDVGWTVDADNGITLALRSKDRSDGSTTNTSGTYNEQPGYDPIQFAKVPPVLRAKWNWEFSINSGTSTLDTYDYYLGVDTDLSVGVSQTIINALTFHHDNAYGTSATANGGGTKGTSAVFASTNTVAQNSRNITFAPWSQDPTKNATYDYELYAVEKGAGPLGDKLASTSIQVIVGTGGQTVQQLINALAIGVKSHGQYMKAINDLLKYLEEGGVINKDQRKELHNVAAQSSVGK